MATISTMQPAHCLNCGTPLAAGHKFCPVCGQKGSTGRLTFHDVLHDAIHFLTHADKGIFHLLAALAKRPGMWLRNISKAKEKPISGHSTSF